MNAQDNGGPAFPGHVQNMMTGHVEEIMAGMTLRDYFAAKAMQAFLPNTETTYKQDAECSYKMADAMLEARK
jgi:hypothetical protein